MMRLGALSIRLSKQNWDRRILLPFLDSSLIGLSLYLTLLIRYEGAPPAAYLSSLWWVFLVALLAKLPVFARQGLYRISWAYVGFADLVAILKAVTFGTIFLMAVSLALRGHPAWALSPSAVAIDYLLTLMLVAGARSAKRLYREEVDRASPSRGPKALIVGAGDAGERLLAALIRQKAPRISLAGFVDDNPAKWGLTIHGVRVLGNRESIPRLVERLSIQELLIAMPSAPRGVIRRTLELGRRAGVKRVKILPGLRQMMDGDVILSQLRELRVADLLGREPVRIQTREVQAYLGGKTVLVTGAAGSIGSELCYQIAHFHPGRLIALDREETGLFYLRQDMNRQFPTLNLEVAIADILDEERLGSLFARFRPEVVFHAAAYKHVRMMEEHPEEAAKNNVLGTWKVGQVACFYGADKFVLISTDKAVNPSSVMGATKRLAEMIMLGLNQRGPTRFVAVRFGNVLGSRGSVTTIFEEQIRRGGPVTVTHPDMRRYFMTAPEAAQLVLQAGALGQGGEVFVLDMGAPVKIVELAREMIRLAGLEPDRDIPIVFTGPLPGEKLFEDILMAEEGTIATRHEKIYAAKLKAPPLDIEGWSAVLLELEALSQRGDREGIIRALQRLVPTYQPSNGQATLGADGSLAMAELGSVQAAS